MHHDVGGEGWGNNQLEYNTDELKNAYHTGEGTLNIVAYAEPYGDNYYTSARIHTFDKVYMDYGRVEARMKLPRGQGLWPAFWMLGERFVSIGWPNCGEIDIMEYRGQEPGTIHGTVHGPGYSGGGGIGESYSLFGDTFDDDYHVFAIERDPQHISWWVDDELYYRLTPADIPAGTAWAFEDQFFVILNLAVGGDYVGSPDPSTEFPATVSVDYVRYYERTEE